MSGPGRSLPQAGGGRAIRVLWLIDSLTAGGAEALTVRFAEAALRRGSPEVEVAFLKSIGGNPFEESLRAAGLEIHAIHSLGARNLRDLTAFRRLRRLIAERGIDLVHAHLAYASIWALLAAGRCGSGGKGVPVVTTLHVRPPADGALTREGARRRLRVALSNRWAARVIAVSEAVRRAWVEEAGLDPARATVVHNGIDVGAFELAPGARERARAEVRRELAVPPEAPLVMAVAVLREGKGLEVLIDAARAIGSNGASIGSAGPSSPSPGVRFVVVGEGPAAGALRERAGGEGRVLFTGFRSDVPRLLAAADLFVLPTLDDAFPTVLLEAMAAGLPVVASDTGGVPEIVSARGEGSTGETGVLVPPGDAGALAAAIAGLLADEPRRRAMGEAGRRRVRERFSADAWLDRLERVYAEALAREGGRRRGNAVRIAVVEPAGKGGLIHYAFQLSRALHELGAEVVLVTDRSYELGALDAPFRVERLLRLWDSKPAREPGRLVRALRRVSRATRYYREQLRLVRYLRRLSPDVVQLGDLRFAGDLAMVTALRASGLALADVCHNVRPFALAGSGAGGFGGGRVARALYRRTYRSFGVIFVHGEENRRRFVETYGVAPERVRAIVHGNELLFEELREASGTAVDAAALRRRLELPADAPVVLALGTLARYKGLDVLVEAFASARARVMEEAPDARLVIAGFPLAGFDPEELRRRARELGAGDAVRVEAGYVPSEEVASWMELAAVAAYPHREVYQSGALQVATSFGVPVVASRVGAIPDVVQDGETGLLVPPDDSRALATALVRLLSDRSLARRLGERAAEEARSRFAWPRVAAELLAAYRDLP